MGFATLKSTVLARIQDATRERRERLRLRRPIDYVIDRMISETTEDANGVETAPPQNSPVTIPEFLKDSWASDETGEMRAVDDQPSFEMMDTVDLPTPTDGAAESDLAVVRDDEMSPLPAAVEDLASISFEDILAEFMRDGNRNTTVETNGADTLRGQAESALAAGDRGMLELSLEDMADIQIDKLRTVLVRAVQDWQSGQSARVQRTVKQPRRKHIDARHTIRRRMVRSAGIFNGFSYRDSPTTIWQTTKPVQLLVICDVSGSMGHYVAIVLYALSCFAQIGQVESYVFSDEPTYVSPLLNENDFRTQFQRLKSESTSWEYGTRLSLALQTVISDGRYNADTTVLLFTDGGFSLIGSDWEDTAIGLAALHCSVRHLYVVTPNLNLVVDGPACAEELWDVERATRNGDELLTARHQKIARFGLLARCSREIILCQTASDLVTLLDKVAAGASLG